MNLIEPPEGSMILGDKKSMEWEEKGLPALSNTLRNKSELLIYLRGGRLERERKDRLGASIE